MKYILNKDQQKALDAFIQFLLNPNQHEMVLTSGPGCGKSFLTGYIKQNAMELYKKGGSGLRLSGLYISAPVVYHP